MSLFGTERDTDKELLEQEDRLVKAFDREYKALRDKTDREIETLNHKHEIATANLINTHSLALKEKDFELKHSKDREVQAAQEKMREAQKALEVAKKEIEMLQKITDLNADIIDIKDLVTKIIDKLPEINLTSLTVQGGSNGNK